MISKQTEKMYAIRDALRSYGLELGYLLPDKVYLEAARRALNSIKSSPARNGQ